MRRASISSIPFRSIRSLMLVGAIALGGLAAACSDDAEPEATATPSSTVAADATQASVGTADASLAAYSALVEDVTGAFPDITLIEDTGAFEVGGLAGEGRRVLVFGTAAELPSFVEIEQTLRGILEADGWAEDMQHAADGTSATLSVWEKGEDRAILGAGVSLKDPSACPADQLIVECIELIEPSEVNVQGSITVASR